ncbi:hypothetical protein, partial [Bradyrhizobium brasilense]|uniref:hypothetical protein n=1 Tax=Bradyrhizobium brasilense TaxID=1419277 RepID=UPI001E400483
MAGLKSFARELMGQVAILSGSGWLATRDRSPDPQAMMALALPSVRTITRPINSFPAACSSRRMLFGSAVWHQGQCRVPAWSVHQQLHPEGAILILIDLSRSAEQP